MNPDFAVALARYLEDPLARDELRRLRRRPLTVAERLEVARRLLELDDARTAALWLFRARHASPDDATVAYWLANALRTAGRVRAAEGILRRLNRVYPAWAEPAQSLAWLYRRAGNAGAAAAALEHWLAAVGTQRKGLMAVSAFLQDMGMDARAEAVLATGPKEDGGLAAERGRLLVKLGRFEEAETQLRQAVAREPNSAGAWLRLAHLQRWRSPEASPLALMRDGLRHSGLDDSVRACIGFGMAKIEDDLGEYSAAWQTLEWANALRLRRAHFDGAAWRNYERAAYAVCSPEFFSAPAGLEVEPRPEAPVFVVGMPRSGTTLLERRLGRHSALISVGESEVVEALGRELAGERGYPFGLATVSADAYGAAARTWRARLPLTLAGSAGEIVDKNPMNFLHLGLIARLFPRARIVHCRRDPLDTALSIWFQNFSHPQSDYAYRFADIAWMFALYRRMMAHWERVLPIPIRAVDYEALIAAPEARLRTLIEWLNLPWEANILDDAAADDGAINTASAWQARQPVYRHALGRARHYEPWIAPLRAALAQAGIQDTASAPRASPE